MVICNLSVNDAAKIMGVNPQFIRIGLQQGRFPWGYAVKMRSKFSYFINKAQFMQTLGIE